MRVTYSSSYLAGSLLTAASIAHADVPTTMPTAQPVPAGVLYRDVRYADASAGRGNLLDLYVPANTTAPVPLILYVHGGGWIEGSKDACPAADGLMRLGYAVASLNYRLLDEAIFPAQIDDCRAALKFLRASSRQFAIDPDRVGAFGESAGGHLVALLGTTPDDSLRCVIDFFGPADLTTYAGQIDPKVAPAFLLREPTILTRLLGGTPAAKHDLAVAASPALHASKACAPFLILHGDRDPIVPLAQSRDFDAALRAVGVESTLIVVPGAGHGGAAFYTPANLQAMVDFLDKHLSPKRR